MSDERGVQPHGPEQVGGDYGGQHLVIERLAGVIAEHDPGVVDDDVQIWMVRDHLGHDARNAHRVGHIQLHSMHPGVSRCDRVQRRGPPPGDDDLVAPLVQFLGQAAPDAGAPAGDQDRVAAELHRSAFRRKAACWPRT